MKITISIHPSPGRWHALTCCRDFKSVYVARTYHRGGARRCLLISTLSSWATSNCKTGALSNVSESRAQMIVHTSGALQECRSVILTMQDCLVAARAAGTICSTTRSFDRLFKVRTDCHSASKLYKSLKTLLKFYFFSKNT